MKGFVEATQGVDLCLTGPSLKDIAKQAKGSTIVCEEVRSMPEICAKHSSTRRSP